MEKKVGNSVFRLSKSLHSVRMKTTEAFPMGTSIARTDTIPLINNTAQFSELILLSLNPS